MNHERSVIRTFQSHPYNGCADCCVVFPCLVVDLLRFFDSVQDGWCKDLFWEIVSSWIKFGILSDGSVLDGSIINVESKSLATAKETLANGPRVVHLHVTGLCEGTSRVTIEGKQ